MIKIERLIHIDKYLKIDKYVDEYIDITEGKIDLFNNLGLILSKATDEIQNAVYIVNDLKQKENLDIKTLKAMHETLEKVMIKWMKTISKTFENDKVSDMKPDMIRNLIDRLIKVKNLLENLIEKQKQKR